MKLCTFPGCERKYCASGYCKVHYNILKKEGAVRPIGFVGHSTRKPTIRLCSLEGCDRKHEAKGLCKKHWSQQHYNRQERIHLAKICQVEGCEKERKARGYCLTHYMRWRNTGTTDIISRAKINSTKNCLHEGCNTKKRIGGYCHKHYRENVLQVLAKPRGGHNKKPKSPCDIDGCKNFARVRGWCDKHYGRFRRNGDPLTCYRRPRKSEYVSIDNILKAKGTYSKADDEEILRENFSDLYSRYERENAHY